MESRERFDITKEIEENSLQEQLIGQKQNELQQEADCKEKLGKYENWTKEIKRGHSKTVNKLTRIAQGAGFKKLLLSPFFVSDDIYVDENIGRDVVIFPENGLENHELLEKIDNNFARRGFRLVALHEKQHLKGPSDEFYYDYRNIAIESQTNLQSINENSRDFKDIADSIASDAVYTDFIYTGIETLDFEGDDGQYAYYKNYYNFLEPAIIDKAVERENEIRKELLEKYNKIKDNWENK